MSTIKANTLLAADGTSTTQPSIPALDTRFAKAWVNFNGTGVVAIRDSYNVSSITDSSTGQYIINFTNNLANANFAVAAFAGRNATPLVAGYANTRSVSSLTIATGTTSFVLTDVDSICTVIFGN